jgi:FkbM family methyltransferase
MEDLREQRARGPAWLRRLFARPRLLPLTALVLRARTVHSSTLFVAREILRRRGEFAYRVRGGNVRVLVRHGTADPVTLGEVFHQRDYEPPPGMPELHPRRVVDLGANVGYFGAFALDAWPGTSVIAYEPDPANVAVHARTIALNGLADRWELRPAAAATRDGQLGFNASGDALSHADERGELVVAAEDVLPLVRGADLLKMDIEGGEWAILMDPRFSAQPPRTVVLEYHPRGAPGPNTHAAVQGHLAAAGLNVSVTVFQRDDGYGMVWAWQP